MNDEDTRITVAWRVLIEDHYTKTFRLSDLPEEVAAAIKGNQIIYGPSCSDDDACDALLAKLPEDEQGADYTLVTDRIVDGVLVTDVGSKPKWRRFATMRIVNDPMHSIDEHSEEL